MKRKLITSSSNEVKLLEHTSELGATRVKKDVVYDRPEFIEFMHDIGEGVAPDIDRDFGVGFKGGTGLVGGRFELYQNPVSGHLTIKFSVAISGAGFAATLVFDRQQNLISHDIFGGGQLIFGNKTDILGVGFGASGTVQIGVFLNDDGIDIGVDTEISVGVLVGSFDINESYRIPVYEFETIDVEGNSFDVTSKFAAMDRAFGTEQWGYRDENGTLHSVAEDFEELSYDIKRNPRRDGAGRLATNVDVETRIRDTHAALDLVAAQFSAPTRRLFDEIPSEATFPANGFLAAGSNADFHVNAEQQHREALPASVRRGNSNAEPTLHNEPLSNLVSNELVEALPGVGAALDRRSKMMFHQLARGTNNEHSPVSAPTPRPRPKLNPITEGFLKDMPDDGRFILLAEMAGQKGRQDADQAEAERLARFDAQRNQKQDLDDVSAGRPSTTWDRYGHPKVVRDLLGEEAYQSFVDDRLEAGIIAHATAGLHLLQDRDLFDIAEGTTQPDAPHERLADLVTPKVRAATAEHARSILDKRKTKPSDAVLLSSELAQRKEKLDAAFAAEEGVDVEEMDAFLFYHEAAQREIGIAETAIELIPPRWAGQIAELFETPKTTNGIPMDRRARRIEVNQHYTDLQQRFGPRTDDVISYSLARAASASVQPSAQRDSQLRT